MTMEKYINTGSRCQSSTLSYLVLHILYYIILYIIYIYNSSYWICALPHGSQLLGNQFGTASLGPHSAEEQDNILGGLISLFRFMSMHSYRCYRML